MVDVLLLCLSVGLTAAAACSHPRSHLTPTVNKYITVGRGPFASTLVRARLLYVTNADSDSISVVDTSTDTVINTIPIGHPTGIASSRDGTEVYVVTNEDDIISVAVIDTKSQKIITKIELSDAEDSSFIALTESGNVREGYVSNVYSRSARAEGTLEGFVSVLDLRKHVVLTKINISSVTSNYSIGCPEGIAVVSAGKHADRWLYLNTQCASARPSSPGHDPIFQIETQSNSVVDVINFAKSELPNVGTGLGITPDGRQIWAAGGDACSQPSYDHLGCEQGCVIRLRLLMSRQMGYSRSYSMVLRCSFLSPQIRRLRF